MPQVEGPWWGVRSWGNPLSFLRRLVAYLGGQGGPRWCDNVKAGCGDCLLLTMGSDCIRTGGRVATL